MPKNKRIEDLERLIGGRGGPTDVVKHVEMTADDEVVAYYVVDGVAMSEGEFHRRWPNYNNVMFKSLLMSYCEDESVH